MTEMCHVDPVARWFHTVMREEMAKNTDKTHWSMLPYSLLVKMLDDEVKELKAALLDDPNCAPDEAADVANIAMMIADNARAGVMHAFKRDVP